MGELEARGIAVRYLAFPRSGAGTKAWSTMAAVWCAGDRREALTRATRGEEVKGPEGRVCSDAVIAKHALAQQLLIPGTPMIVMGDGASLGGYMSPDKMLAVLEERAAEPTNGMSGKSHEQWLAAGKRRTQRAFTIPGILGGGDAGRGSPSRS